MSVKAKCKMQKEHDQNEKGSKTRNSKQKSKHSAFCIMKNSTKNIRPVIYQLFPRLFANRLSANVPWGDISTNGSGKLNDITNAVLRDIAGMGITHVWYTGIIEHAHQTDYSAFGIERHNPHVVKGLAGSPYAITDYYDVDPDIAVDVDRRMAEFEGLMERTHDAGMQVIIDFVPNHVGRQYHSDVAPAGVDDFGVNDNKEYFFSPSNNFYYIPRQQFEPCDVWLGEGDDRYVEFPARATGNDCYTAFPGRNDWYETVKLNYGLDPGNGSRHFDPIPDTWFKMLHILRFWASKGVDGFRCDMAHMVPVEFWKWAITLVKKDYPHVLFIAELYDVAIYRTYLYDAGFDYLYDKVNLYDTLRGITNGTVSAAQLTSSWQTIDGVGDRMLNFLENHDEQRYASDFFAGTPDTVLPALTAICTMSRGAVMIYNGQELGERGMDQEGFSGLDGRTTIFDYWSMDPVRRWLNDESTDREKALRGVYCKMLSMVNKKEEFRSGSFFDLMYVNYESPGLNPHRHFVFLRSTAKESCLVFLNFDNTPAEAHINIPLHAFEMLGLTYGEVTATDYLTGSRVKLNLAPNRTVEVKVAPNGVRMLGFKQKNH